jgi:hypothetical protein
MGEYWNKGNIHVLILYSCICVLAKQLANNEHALLSAAWMGDLEMPNCFPCDRLRAVYLAHKRCEVEVEDDRAIGIYTTRLVLPIAIQPMYGRSQ